MKIFSVGTVTKFYGHSILVINICGIKIKLSRNTIYKLLNFKYHISEIIKKIKGNDIGVIYYLSKYKYIIDLADKELNNCMDNNNASEHVWTMWLQEDIPLIIQACLKTIKHFYPQTIVITDKNIKDYIDIPDVIYKKYKDGIIKSPHFSDYVRMCLLDKYGGTWIDASCYMTAEIPKFIIKQDFFVFQNNNQSKISNFFIHSVSNNKLTKCMRIFLEEYWKNENITINYFMFHIFLMYLVKEDPKCREIFYNIVPELQQKVHYFNPLASRLKFNEDLWEYLKNTCFLYKIHRKDVAAMEKQDGFYQYFINNTNFD